MAKSKEEKAAYHLEYQRRNRDKIKIYNERAREAQKLWPPNKLEELREYHRKYNAQHYQQNKAKVAARTRVNRKKREEADPAEVVRQRAKRTAWGIKNRDALNRWYQNRKKIRRASDSYFCLVLRLRNRIEKALKRIGGSQAKADKTIVLLGCSFAAYKSHIEAQFTAGMTWERFHAGEIHIDHIRPCVSFDLSDPEQQKACFHYSNLQPLWGPDNLSKGARLDWKRPT